MKLQIFFVTIMTIWYKIDEGIILKLQIRFVTIMTILYVVDEGII